MKFAVFTVSLPDWTPEEAVRNLAELGYDGVEWRIADDPPRATPGFWQGNRSPFPSAPSSRMRHAFGRSASRPGWRSRPLPATSRRPTWRTSSGCCAEWQHWKHADGTHSSPRYDGQASYVELWERARRDYQEVARQARAHGVKALVEIHHETIVPSASAARRFLDGF